MKRQNLLIVVLVLLLLINFPFVSVQGSPLKSDQLPYQGVMMDHPILCYGLDVVFIVDQSGSMSGATYPPSNPNDPLGQRAYAPRYSLNWLANNRLGLCQNVVHRVGMVSYGKEASIDLPLTHINPTNQSDWEAARLAIENQIEAKVMGDTNPLTAFEMAAQMLDSAQAMEDSTPRKKAIILLTDGKACVPELGCLPDGDGMDHEAYNQRIEQFVAEHFTFSEAVAQQDQALRKAVQQYGRLSEVPDDVYNRILLDHPVTSEDLANSVYIWAVAMNSASDYLQTDGETLKRIASVHGGELIDLEENLIAVPRTFNQILSWLAGVSPDMPRCGPLAVYPYLSGAVLDVFKLGEDYEVKITYKGKQISKGAGDTRFFGVSQYTEFGAIEHYTFRKPPAGLWKIEASDCDAIQASFLPFDARLIMQGPTRALPLYNRNNETSDPDHPVFLQYKIIDQANSFELQEDPEYPLDNTATITDPAGKTHTLKLGYKSEGIWESTEALPVHLVGQYKVSVTGVAPCVINPEASRPDPRCQDGRFTVFSDSTGTYKVSPVSLFDFKIIEPRPNQEMWLHEGLFPGRLQTIPVDVTVQLVDANNQPLAAEDVLTSDASQAFTVQFDAGGKTKRMTMTPDRSDSSKFHAHFTSPAEEGSQLITVAFQAQWQHEKYSPAREKATLPFTRIDPLTHKSSFWLSVGGGIGLLLLALLLLLLNKRRVVLRGSLMIGSSPEAMTPLPLPAKSEAQLKNAPCGFSKIIVKPAGKSMNKRVVSATFIPPKGQGQTITRILIDGAPASPVTNGVFARYYWGGKA